MVYGADRTMRATQTVRLIAASLGSRSRDNNDNIQRRPNSVRYTSYIRLSRANITSVCAPVIGLWHFMAATDRAYSVFDYQTVLLQTANVHYISYHIDIAITMFRGTAKLQQVDELLCVSLIVAETM